MGQRGVGISVAPAAQMQVLSFLKTSELEQGGLLLGRIWSRPSAPNTVALVEILEAIASLHSKSSAYSLQMNAGVWSSAQECLSRFNHALSPEEQTLRIVGWFHSHPHMGAFFSATDVETQRAFFNQAYSVGWVIDPYTTLAERHEAFFLGPDCVPVSRLSLNSLI